MDLIKKLKSKSTQYWKIKLNIKKYQIKKFDKTKKIIKRMSIKSDRKKNKEWNCKKK
jgi:hypothetical protein